MGRSFKSKTLTIMSLFMLEGAPSRQVSQGPYSVRTEGLAFRVRGLAVSDSALGFGVQGLVFGHPNLEVVSTVQLHG